MNLIEHKRLLNPKEGYHAGLAVLVRLLAAAIRTWLDLRAGRLVVAYRPKRDDRTTDAIDATKSALSTWTRKN